MLFCLLVEAMHSVQNQKSSSFHGNQKEDFQATDYKENKKQPIKIKTLDYICKLLTNMNSDINNHPAPLNLCGTHPYCDNVRLHR